MRASGRITRLMGKGSSITQTVMSLMGSGLMTRLMALVCINILMELNMKESGSMIFNMGME